MTTFEIVQNNAHEIAIKNGYYAEFDKLLQSTNKNDKLISLLAILNLLQQEVSEAGSALRKDKFVPEYSHKFYDKKYFNENVKDTFEAELADAFIFIISLCKHLDINILHLSEIINFHNYDREYQNGKRL